MESNVKVRIDAIDTTKAAFASVRKNLDGVSESVDKVRYDLSSVGDGMQQLAAIGTVAFSAIGFGSLRAINAATNLGESINAVNVVFGDAAGEILKFGETAATSVGLSNSAFNQMATKTGTILSNTGREMGVVADMTNELSVRAADLASVYNTDVDQAMAAIQSALIGQSEPLRNYGVVLTEAQLKAFALSEGIIDVERELTEQEKTLARYEYIMAATTKQAGDFYNTSDSLANVQRTLSSQIEDVSAKLGEQLAPILSDVFDELQPMITALGQWIEQNPELAKDIIIAAGAIAGLIGVIGALGLAILAFNPMAVIIIGAIAGISLIAYSVQKAMDMLGITWTNVWNGIKDVTLKAIDLMLGPLDEIVVMVDRALEALAKLPGVKSAVSITKSAFRSVSDLFRADGGPVTGGTPYIVGERGPELFVPGVTGSIVPNNRLATAGVGGPAAPTFVFNVMGDLTEKVKTSIMRDLQRSTRL